MKCEYLHLQSFILVTALVAGNAQAAETMQEKFEAVLESACIPNGQRATVIVAKNRRVWGTGDIPARSRKPLVSH